LFLGKPRNSAVCDAKTSRLQRLKTGAGERWQSGD